MLIPSAKLQNDIYFLHMVLKEYVEEDGNHNRYLGEYS